MPRHRSWLRRRVVLVLLPVLLLALVSSALLMSSRSASLQAQRPPIPTATAAPLPPFSLPPAPPAPTTISAENALPGNASWLVSQPDSVAIQAYADATSVSPGTPLTFYVSTEQAGTPYTVQVYRLGWYGGLGGRLLWTGNGVGQAQGVYDGASKRLIGCASCHLDPATHLLEARWHASFSLPIPTTWVTGLYEAKLTDAHGSHATVFFTVRGAPFSAYLVVVADNTTEAYNDWGGYSLYHGPDGSKATRAFKVSFDRPTHGWYFYVLDTVRWLEREGYDLSYASSVDLDEYPAQLLNHRAYLSLGHDEYWSSKMRQGVETARNHGVGLAFLGGNDMYWQIRYEPDSLGAVDRTIVCYKSAAADPLSGTDNALVTVRWRQAPVRRPENAIIGIMFEDYANAPAAYPWRVNPATSSPLLTSTHLQPGQSYGCNLVGNEWDTVYDNGFSPAGLTILGSSPVVSLTGQHETASTAYYVAPSGAFVFASGSIYWGYALDNLRAPEAHPTSCEQQSRAIPGIQTLMANVMSALIANHHASAIH